jgi:hypothetical protein
MIIVSESSAEATRPVRADRSTPVRSRSSAVHNDAPRHSEARPISVHKKRSRGHFKPSPSASPGSSTSHRRKSRTSSLERLTPSLDDTIAALAPSGMACSRYRSGTGAYGDVSGACEVHIHYQIIMFPVWGKVERKCHYAWNVSNLPLFSTHTLVG